MLQNVKNNKYYLDEHVATLIRVWFFDFFVIAKGEGIRLVLKGLGNWSLWLGWWWYYQLFHKIDKVFMFHLSQFVLINSNSLFLFLLFIIVRFFLFLSKVIDGRHRAFMRIRSSNLDEVTLGSANNAWFRLLIASQTCITNEVEAGPNVVHSVSLGFVADRTSETLSLPVEFIKGDFSRIHGQAFRILNQFFQGSWITNKFSEFG